MNIPEIDYEVEAARFLVGRESTYQVLEKLQKYLDCAEGTLREASNLNSNEHG